MNSVKIVGILNELIGACKDGEQDYKFWLDWSRNHQPEWEALFSERQFCYATFISDLQDLVLTHRGDPETNGTTAAAVNRGLTRMKAVLLGIEDGSVLRKCTAADKIAAHSYRKALASSLPSHIHSILGEQYQSILHYLVHMKRRTKEVQLSRSSA